MYSFNRLSRVTTWSDALRVTASLCALSLVACGGYGAGASSDVPPPTITLAVQPASVRLGESAQLSWTATVGAACTATGGWTGTEPATGTQRVTPAALGPVSYTLTCHTPAGGMYGSGSTDAAKSVTLNVTPANAFSATSLAADTASANELDTRLVNPWGVAFGPTSTAWVTNNRTNTATLYDGNGRAQPAASPRTVTLPIGAGGAPFEPTGIVFNTTTDFVIHSETAAGPAKFIFVGKGGSLAAWSPIVDLDKALDLYNDPTSVYTGLAIANDGADNFLYAADFHNNRVDVFDADFVKQLSSDTRFAFVDADLPAGYAPFGIQTLNTDPIGAPQIYVAYAKQSAPDNRESLVGAGLGLVDVYDTHGQLLKQLISTGSVLNAPWGMALAPADFGALTNRLLVSNFGDGRINAYSFVTGQFAATLSDLFGNPFSLPGLRGIAFGNDANNQPHNTLFYAAGINDEANGEFGRIDLGATPPLLDQAPIVTISGPQSGNVSAIVDVSATVESSIAVAKVEFFAEGVSLGSVTTAPYTVQWDTAAFANGAVLLTARATDVDGTSGVSTAVRVTIANGVPLATLTQIQAQVFTPICSGCHNGSNPPTGALPGAQNLTAGNSFANLVNVTSKELPTLLRVKPGDPANSYLIQKLEGAAGIQGARMPFGGPFLDQAAIDRVKAWIASGAPNN